MHLPKIHRSSFLPILFALALLALYFLFQFVDELEQFAAGEISSVDFASIFSLHFQAHLFSSLLRVAVLLGTILLSRRAFESAHKNKERLERILETAADGIYFVNRSGRMTMVNAAVERMLGATREEICQTSYNHPRWKITTLDGNPFPDAEQPFARVIKTGAPVYGVEQCIERADGERVIVSINATPLRNVFGQVIGEVGTLTDITARMCAEQTLRESQEQYRRLSEAAYEGIVITENAIVLEANIRSADILGYRLDEMIGKNVANFVAPESLDQVMQHIRTNSEEPYEFLARRKDGTVVPVETRAKSIPYHGRRVRVTALNDLTERKQAEAERSKFALGIERTGEAVFMTNPDGVITYVNPAFEQIYGYSKDEAIGKTPRILKSGLLGKETYAHFWQTLLSKQGTRGEIINKSKNGELVTIDGSANPILDDYGNIIGFLAIQRDITERKRAESQVRLMSHAVEQSPTSIVITDPTGAIQYVNPKFSEVTGYTADEAVGQNPRILKSGHTSTEEYQELWRTITSGREWNGEFLNKKKNGEPYWESAVIAPVMNANGEITHFLAVKEDITERKRAEVTLKESETRYRSLFENMLEGYAYCQMIFEKDRPVDFIYLNVNKAFEDLTGLSNVVGKKVTHVIPGIRESDPALLEMYGRVARTRKPERSESYLFALQMWFSISVYSPEPDHFIAVFDVITERKRAEAALQQVERRYRELFESDATMNARTANHAGEPYIVECNDLFARTLGYSRAELVGHSIAEFYSPDSTAKMRQGGYQRALSGAFTTADRSFVTRDGQEIDVLVTSVPEVDEKGLPIGTQTAYVDITERKRAEAELSASEERYKNIVENANDIIYRTDAEGRFIFYNPTASRILKYSADELLGRNYLELVHPSQRRETALYYLKQKAHAIPTTYRELIVIGKEGQEFWIGQNVQLLKEGDQIVGFQALARDITDQKRAEEKLAYQANLLAQVHDAVIAFDHNFIVTSWNHGAEKIYGWSADEIIGQTAEKAFRAEFADKTLVQVRQQIQATGEYVGEVIQYRKDGTRIFVEGHTKALRTIDGTLTGYLTINHEITERKRAESEIQRRAEQLATLNEIGRAVSTERDVPRVLETIYEQVSRIIPFDAFYVALYEPNMEELVFPLLTDGGRRFESERHKPVPGTDLCKTLKTGTPRLIIRTPAEMAQAIKPATALGDTTRQSAALLYAPLLVKGQVIGVISAQSYTLNAYTEAHLQLLSTIAHQAAIALDNARLLEALSQSEDRYKALYERAPIAYYSVSAEDGRIRLANGRLAEMLGYSVDELMSRPIFELYADTPSGKAKARQIFERFRTGEEIRSEELQMLTSTGEPLWVSVSVQAVRDEQGKVIHSRSMAFDISRRKKAEEEILRRNQQLGALNQIGQAMNYRVTPAEILELIHEKINLLLDNRNLYIALYDQATQQISFPVYTIHGERRSPTSRPFGNGITEHILRTKIPLWIPNEMNATLKKIGIELIGQPARCFLGVPLLVGDKAIGVIAVQDYQTEGTFTASDVELLSTFASQAAIAIDNTRLVDALRHSEVKYRNIFENAVVGIYQSSLDGKWVAANSSLARMLGYDSPVALMDSMSDLNRQFYVNPDRRAEFAQQMQESNVVWGFESETYRRDGSVIWISENARAVRDASGALVGFEGTTIDITDRKQVDRLKSEFVSVVSHELRTPLTSIRGSLGLIAGGVAGQVSPKAKALVDIAHKNSERLVLLINDILDMEKIESGKMEFDNQPMELAPLLEQAVEANTGYADQYGVRLDLKNEWPGVQVNADAGRLTQVVTNLISNAVKFSPRDGAVGILVSRRKAGVRVSIRDSGSGIPEEFRSRIFQKFAQADASTTRQKGGTGLGLSICKAIVEKLGGRIGFETERNVGTTFFFDLPEWVVPSPALAGSPEKTRLLICEDDRDTIMLLQLLLEQAGFATDIAHDAAEAKQMLCANKYAGMTLDLMLPGQDGISLIRELREHAETRDLPVIVVSLKAEQGRQALNGDAIQVIDWISKPIDPKRLLGAVRCAAAHSSHPAHILHIDDDRDVLEIAAVMLQSVAIVDHATTLKDARQCLEHQHYDLAILDLEMPDGSGLELVPLLQQQSPPVPIVIYSIEEISQATAAQAAAVLVKSRTSNDQLVETIRALVLGRQLQLPEVIHGHA